MRWGVVVPVKDLASAKSRLGDRTPSQRRAFASACAQDTVAAILALELDIQLVIVTNDAAVARLFQHSAVTFIDDPNTGINAAIEAGAKYLRSAAQAPLAAVCADLPCLRTDALARILIQAGEVERGYVPDAEALGTTILTARPGAQLQPEFGPDSARAHQASGAATLTADPCARRDVDDESGLQAATALGLGPATSRTVAAWAMV